MVQVNEEVEGTIQALAFGGEGILRQEGIVIFVPFTAIGEQVRCRLTQVKKSFAKAELLQIIKPSPERTQPRCPYYGQCGGCQLQHLSPQAQMDYKLKSVQDALERIGRLTFPPPTIVPATLAWAYRRHITLQIRACNGSWKMGYVTIDGHSLLSIESCPIFNQAEDKVIHLLHSFLNTLPAATGIEGRVTLLRNHHSRYVLAFTFNGFKLDESLYARWLEAAAVFTSSSRISVSRERSDGAFCDEGIALAIAEEKNAADDLLTGDRKLLEEVNTAEVTSLFEGILLSDSGKTRMIGNCFSEIYINGLTFRFTPQSFVQNHPEQSLKIYQHIARLVGSQRRLKVIDLYCGFGITSLLLAQEGHQVMGIEYNPEAIRFAKNNSQLNHLQDRTHFLQGDVAKLLPKRAGNEGNPSNKWDVVIINPPRQGMDKVVAETIGKMSVPQLIYVSCMPSTLARDLAYLCTQGYSIESVTVYDMFPQTAHVETLVHLVR